MPVNHDNAKGKYPSPKYLLGALATDGAPMRVSVKIAQGYAAALEDLDDEGLHEWRMATYQSCLSRGWHQAALAIICLPSGHQAPTYEEKAEKYLQRVGQKEVTRG